MQVPTGNGASRRAGEREGRAQGWRGPLTPAARDPAPVIGLFHSCEIGLARNLLDALANPQRQKLAGPRLRWYLAAQILPPGVPGVPFARYRCRGLCRRWSVLQHRVRMPLRCVQGFFQGFFSRGPHALCRLASVAQCFRAKRTQLAGLLWLGLASPLKLSTILQLPCPLFLGFPSLHPTSHSSSEPI